MKTSAGCDVTEIRPPLVTFACRASDQAAIIRQNKLLTTLLGLLIGAFDCDAGGKSSAEFQQMMPLMNQAMAIVKKNLDAVMHIFSRKLGEACCEESTE